MSPQHCGTERDLLGHVQPNILGRICEESPGASSAVAMQARSVGVLSQQREPCRSARPRRARLQRELRAALTGGPACRRGGRLVPAGSTGLCAASLSATVALGRDPWHQLPAPVCSAPSATALWLSGQRSAPAHDGQACAVAARVPGGAL